MTFDKRYFGIYRGSVYDSNDPEGRGRVQLIVPQVLGQDVTDWAYPIGGAISQWRYPYGTFLTSVDQTMGVNTATLITNWTAADANRMYLDNNKIYVQETGDYFIQFSAVITKTNAATGTADIWIRKNGIDLADSNTRITLSGSNAETVMAVALIADLEAGDYLEFIASASSTNTQINASPANTGPAIPGIIATLNLIGKWKPQPEQGVWVMFEGGDPNFPLWTGGY